MGGAVALGAWPVLHDVRARFVVRLGLEWLVRGALHLLQDRRIDGHGIVAARWQARDRFAVVAPLHGLAVLLALVLCTHRHGRVVRVHELFGALDHVRLLRHHGDAVPQGGDAVRHLHYTAAVGPDAGWHFVTVKAVLYQAAGDECHVNKTNSVLGLSMYASYFVLFFKLFVDNYYLKPKGVQKRASLREVARSVSRKVTQHVLDDTDAQAEGEETTKKLN